MFSCVRLSICLFAALSFSAAVANATTFSANTGGTWLGDQVAISGSFPILEVRNASQGSGASIREQRGGFRADGGGLGVEAFVQSTGAGSLNEFSAIVDVLYDDVIFSVDPDRTDIILLPNETIDVFINLSLDGLINVSSTSGAVASGSIAILVNSSSVGSYLRSHYIDSGGTVTVTEEGTGVLDSAAGNQVGLGFGHLLTVPVNTPVNVQLRAIANALVNGDPGASFADVDFFNTLAFDPNQPFTLPDGFTVNSASAGIVDNQVVPEPASCLLIISGVAMLLLDRRKLSHF